MTKRFTEKQYQKIVGIADEYQRHSGFGIIGDTTQKSIGAELCETELTGEIVFHQNAKEIMAIANPLTRDWAHEKFVMEENKYVFRLKSDNDAVVSKSCGNWYLDKIPAGIMYFSDEEIENSPFKLEWFDKAEE